ncbi:7640_t:CDS:2, partial [Diversispora eburnea]
SFDTQIKYAGLPYLGLEQAETVQKLLNGAIFYPFTIEIENFLLISNISSKSSKSIPDDILFAKNHPITLQKLSQLQQILLLQIPNKYTIADWNNQEIMEQLFKLHLKKQLVDLIRNGTNKDLTKSNIIELYTHMKDI